MPDTIIVGRYVQNDAVNSNPESNVRKSELHRLWDDHVAASAAFQTQRAAASETLETLKERMERTKRAYEQFLRDGKVTR